MRKPFLWIMFFAALIAFGCGGGGGDGTSTDGSTGFTFGLSLNPTSVAGGQSSQGTVTISGPAPAGGFSVGLSSSNTSVASVPSSVTVPEGSVSRTFTINTSSVGATTNATITASAGSAQDSQVLEVKRVPVGTGVFGNVRSTQGAAIVGATVKFYTANGTFIKQVTTSAGGSFEATLPTTAARFTVSLSTATGGGNFFNQFGYSDDEYLADELSCLALLPTIVQGQMSSLATSVVFLPKTMGPPPPPTGCLK